MPGWSTCGWVGISNFSKRLVLTVWSPRIVSSFSFMGVGISFVDDSLVPSSAKLPSLAPSLLAAVPYSNPVVSYLQFCSVDSVLMLAALSLPTTTISPSFASTLQQLPPPLCETSSNAGSKLLPSLSHDTSITSTSPLSSVPLTRETLVSPTNLPWFSFARALLVARLPRPLRVDLHTRILRLAPPPSVPLLVPVTARKEEPSDS